MSKRPSTTDQSDTESADGDAFLSRWARRKAVARTGGDPDAAAGDSSLEADELANAVPADEDEQVTEPTDEDMPPVSSIDENSDMSGFFSPKVTQAVKKAALKKFFHSPIFNIVDGLDDYDDDFRNFEALWDIITSDMRGQMEREAERAREAAANDERDRASTESPDSRAEAAHEAHEAHEADAGHEPEGVVDDDAPAEQLAAAEPEREPGVTREPGAKPGAGHAKLRPRSAGDEHR